VQKNRYFFLSSKNEPCLRAEHGHHSAHDLFDPGLTAGTGFFCNTESSAKAGALEVGGVRTFFDSVLKRRAKSVKLEDFRRLPTPSFDTFLTYSWTRLILNFDSKLLLLATSCPGLYNFKPAQEKGWGT
jgi:hypothetical protein